MYLVVGCFHHDLCERLLVTRQYRKAIPQEVQDQRKVLRVPVNKDVPLRVANKHIGSAQKVPGASHVTGASGTAPGHAVQCKGDQNACLRVCDLL